MSSQTRPDQAEQDLRPLIIVDICEEALALQVGQGNMYASLPLTPALFAAERDGQAAESTDPSEWNALTTTKE